MSDKLSRADFEQAYAERSGVTVEWLHEQGRAAFPCECGAEICEGWQMVNAVNHLETPAEVFRGI